MAQDRVRLENQTLYAVIKTVSSSLALDRVLDGIVEIATEATGCHACFVYFVQGDRLELRAASPLYAHLVGEVGFGLDEGLTGWVARTKTPEFIRDKAMQDPRMKYVPELEEERFQSMVAVPVCAKAGDVIGVIVLHTEAPREFEDDVLEFLVHTASLVGGAIENAQLYGEARRRVEALTTLTQLSQSLASVTLGRTCTTPSRAARASCSVPTPARSGVSIPRADELVMAAADPPDAPDADDAPRPRQAAARPHAPRARRPRARAAARTSTTTSGCWWRRSWPATSSSGSSAAWSAGATSARRTRSCCARWPTRPRSA